jgi:hypothetical protein
VKTFFAVVALLCFIIPVSAQKPDPKPTVAQAKPDAPPFPQKNRADILEIELRMAQEQIEYNRICDKTCQEQTAKLQSSFQQDSIALAQAQAKAYKDAGVSDKDWQIDMQKIQFVRRVQPSAVSPSNTTAPPKP